MFFNINTLIDNSNLEQNENIIVGCKNKKAYNYIPGLLALAAGQSSRLYLCNLVGSNIFVNQTNACVGWLLYIYLLVNPTSKSLNQLLALWSKGRKDGSQSEGLWFDHHVSLKLFTKS